MTPPEVSKPPTESFPPLRMVPGFADSDAPAGHTEASANELLRWQTLLGQAGRELAEPLTAALERVTALTTTGHLDRAGLRALRDEIDTARQAGIWCQQIARLASGRVRQSHERVHLTNTVQSVLALRARELQSRSIYIVQALQTVEIQIDASMLYGLLNALAQWWLGCAEGKIEVQIELDADSGHAQLVSQFQHPAPVHASETHHPGLDSTSWYLLEQTARCLGVEYDREVSTTHTRLTLTFARTIRPLAAAPLYDEPDIGFADSINSKPLAGSHVLVVSSQRELRVKIREAIQSMGLVIDFANSVADAAEFCREGLPHGIVFDASLRSPKFDQLVSNIRQEVPEFVFIELTNDGQTFDISGISPSGMARVGQQALATALPSALVFELTRIM